jgi:hypothetical protein
MDLTRTNPAVGASGRTTRTFFLWPPRTLRQWHIRPTEATSLPQTLARHLRPHPRQGCRLRSGTPLPVPSGSCCPGTCSFATVLHHCSKSWPAVAVPSCRRDFPHFQQRRRLRALPELAAYWPPSHHQLFSSLTLGRPASPCAHNLLVQSPDRV